MNERNSENARLDDEFLARRAKQLFDDSVKGLDAATASRLNRARHEALAELQPGARRRQWLRWAPAAGVAAAAVVAVVVMNGRPPADLMTAPASVSDFEILLNEDSFEMLEELEFYSWIDLEGELDGNVG